MWEGKKSIRGGLTKSHKSITEPLQEFVICYVSYIKTLNYICNKKQYAGSFFFFD